MNSTGCVLNTHAKVVTCVMPIYLETLKH